MLANEYDPREIEQKWIKYWEEKGVYRALAVGENDKKAYVLGMFPYPSGEGLHTGHVRIYTAVDVISRYLRMKGYQVLMPIGYDAFGLPAENAAIKIKKNPMDMVPKNESNFKRQMQAVGLSYDWNRAFSTTDPSYYKWTQWLFLKLYSIKNKQGERLIYRKEVPINWCPKCKTGLANEEVLPDGTHERCGTPVEQRLLPQWVMRITDYADRLLNDLSAFDWVDDGGKKRKGLDWPEGILAMQRNWIGRKEGININYPVVDTDEILTCFTTAPVNFGMTFIVVAPEHQLVKKILNGEIKVEEKYKNDVRKYVEETQKKSEMDRLKDSREKTGVFTGLKAKNVVAGWDVPIWVADFVLGHVGTGAVQGCPGHDYKDFEFAKRFNLPIMRVVVGPDGDAGSIDSVEKVIVKGMKGKMVNSQFLDGLEFAEGLKKTMDYVEEKGWGERTVSYHLRDWVFSRQRYWGEPFPLVYCDKCGDENGVVPLEEKDLPLELPYLESYEPTDDGQSPLSRATDWVETTCPKCGGKAHRETDTMPNWAGSCWYFLRFIDPKNDKEAWSKEAFKTWMDVDWYLGGAEHAVLHLLYARFWMKAFYDLGLVDSVEPFLRLRSVGMVLAGDGKKMSKSLGNVVNPDEVVAQYGADSLRIYEMFMGPWDQTIAWDTRSLVGCFRFLEKLWKLVDQSIKSESKEVNPQLADALNKLIKKVGQDILELKFNTSVAEFMKFVNLWTKLGVSLDRKSLEDLLKVLAPFAPFLTEEIWQNLYKDGSTSIHSQEWPKFSEVVAGEVTVVVQVAGKVRGTLKLKSAEASDEQIVSEKAKVDPQIQRWLDTGKYKQVFVPGRLINFVLSSKIE